MSNGLTINLPPNALPSFFSDIRLLTLSSNQRLVQKTLEVLGAYLGATSEAAQIRLESELASSVPSDQMTVRRVLQMLGVLNVNLAIEEDADPAQAAARLIETLQRMAGDKKELRFSEDEASRLHTLFTSVAADGSRVRHEIQIQGITRGILPMFEDLRATLELRSLQWPLSPDATDNQASGFVPIASLNLQLDSGNPSTIFFQATEADLASIINKLQRLEAALSKLKHAADTLSPRVDAQNDA